MKKILSLIVCFFISACSVNAPKYQPSAENINVLQDTTQNKISLGKFGEAKAELNDLSLRGGSLISPYNNSYSAYLTQALEEELRLAGIWDKSSNIQVSGLLIDNQMDISGFSVGTASMKAKFVVTRNTKVVFSKTISAKHEWESSFIGAVAIPAGQNNYPVLVQKLFSKLFKDSSFQQAIR